MKIRTWTLPASLLLLAACFSASPDKKYYQLDLAPLAAGPTLPHTILVDRVEIDSLYDDFRILYRVSPVEVNYYAYHFWAEKPARMLRDALFHRLELSHRFTRVLMDLGKENPDWVLRCTIHQIEEIDAPQIWKARLGLGMELVEFKSGKILAARRFDREAPLGRPDVGLLPGALSRILDEELAALLADLK
jgi:ABC-type uncharacterized transport system auxiliary subunit